MHTTIVAILHHLWLSLVAAKPLVLSIASSAASSLLVQLLEKIVMFWMSHLRSAWRGRGSVSRNRHQEGRCWSAISINGS